MGKLRQMRQVLLQIASSAVPFAKMESRPPSTDAFKLSEEAIFGVSSVMCEPPYIKIASRTGGRDGSDSPLAKRNHFRRAPFPFRPFSFGRAKENGQISSNNNSLRFCRNPCFSESTFLCLDAKESTKGKIKAGEKMVDNSTR